MDTVEKVKHCPPFHLLNCLISVLCLYVQLNGTNLLSARAKRFADELD